MKNIIVIFVGLCIVGGGFFYLKQNKLSIQLVKTKIEIPQVNRSGQTLLTTQIEENSSKPQILEAKIIAENSGQLIFNVTYFYPDSAKDGKYNISIHPNNSSWSYSMNTLEQGTHSLPITVSLRVKDGQNTAASDVLHFYISHAQDNKHIGKVFEQAIPFKKDWKKTGH